MNVRPRSVTLLLAMLFLISAGGAPGAVADSHGAHVSPGGISIRPPAAVRITVPGTSRDSGTATPVDAAGVDGVRSPAPGPAGDRFRLGVNLPWYNWACDFGCGDHGGVSDPAVATAVGDRLDSLAGTGVRALRWWVFPGDPWQITRDRSGRPTGLGEDVARDIAAALTLAAERGLVLDLVLFSAPDHVPSRWLTSPGDRSLLVRVLTPLFEEFNGHPALASWEVINEPEWAIWAGTVPREPVVGLVTDVAAAVHAFAGAEATVGSAMLDGLSLWTGAGLDYYRAHWYDYMAQGDWCALCRTAADVQAHYGLDRPIVIGEFYAGGDVDARQRLEALLAAGYAGASAWSLFPERTADGMAVDLAATRAFSLHRPDLVAPGAAAGAAGGSLPGGR